MLRNVPKNTARFWWSVEKIQYINGFPLQMPERVFQKNKYPIFFKGLKIHEMRMVMESACR